MNKLKYDPFLKRERMMNNEKVITRHITLNDSDYEIAKGIGRGNASQGIKTALRIAVKLDQKWLDELS